MSTRHPIKSKVFTREEKKLLHYFGIAGEIDPR